VVHWKPKAAEPSADDDLFDAEFQKMLIDNRGATGARRTQLEVEIPLALQVVLTPLCLLHASSLPLTWSLLFAHMVSARCPLHCLAISPSLPLPLSLSFFPSLPFAPSCSFLLPLCLSLSLSLSLPLSLARAFHLSDIHTLASGGLVDWCDDSMMV